MLTVTEAAYIHLAKVLDNVDVPADVVVRFVAEDDAINQKLDHIHSGDVRFEFAGKTVLALDEQMSHTLSDTILDVEDDSSETQLILFQI